MRDVKPKVIRPSDSKTLVGQMLGDTHVGSSWRAAEQAATPGVEVTIYVRSLAEALVTFDITMALLGKRNLLPSGPSIAIEAARALAKKYDAFVVVELNNDSVVIFKKEKA